MIVQMLYTSLVVVSDSLPVPPALEVLIPVIDSPEKATMFADMPIDEYTVMRCADTVAQAFEYVLDTLAHAGEPVELVIYQ